MSAGAAYGRLRTARTLSNVVRFSRDAPELSIYLYAFSSSSAISEAVEEYLDKIYYKNILDLKAGIIFINYEYRNELAEYLRENKYDIDFVMMISLDRGVVSYRSTKDGVSVRKVAEYFGGKGHDKAATNPITSKSKEAILEILTTK